MTERVPAAVEEVVARWRSAGCPIQPPIAWPRDRWIARFPQHLAALAAMPDRLDRNAIRSLCTDAHSGPRAAQEAFIAVMAWGFGTTVGYGPFRTHRILTATPGAAERLAAVADTLRGAGPLAAYRRLSGEGDCALRWLGPAFGTKFLYFCQPPGQRAPALILDNLVATWLKEETPLDLNPVPWWLPTYRRYLETMHAWATVLDCAPDDLEYCMFREKATARGSQWGDAGDSS